jgi:chromosomal replication initiation ATPase DnaA
VAVDAPDQPPLPFSIERRFAEADFREAPSNAAACDWLRRTSAWPGGRLALWGGAGCGKTHLLHIWATRMGAALWSGPALRGLPELPDASGIALDNAGEATDETALLHLLNAANEAGLCVLLAGRTPPARWPTRLPDLASRLRAITAVEIRPPEDELLRALLARLLADRQLRLPEPVQAWMLARLPRTAAAMQEAVARLDVAAMAKQQTITIPFARNVLKDEISGTDGDHSPANPPLL